MQRASGGTLRWILVLGCLPATACSFDGSVPLGTSPGFELADAAGPDAFVAPKRDCLEILEAGLSRGDGAYRIDPDGDGGQPAFDTYCDMSRDGGGWTLVYAYTFTDYANFTNRDNAVTPRPDWNFSEQGSVPVSTTPPTALDDFNALEFARWADIGTNVMVQSNVNHWIVCSEGTGSLVGEVNGSMNCQIEKLVASACSDSVPRSVRVNSRGPSLNADALYYYWDGSTSGNWPTHDPCGTNRGNQEAGVESPAGAIFLRR